MKKHLLLTTGLLALVLVGIQPGHAKTFYKWKDENGVTHYSSQKPHDTQAESVEIRGGRQTAVDTETQPADSANTAGQRSSSNASSTASSNDTTEGGEKALNPERCAEAKDNLATLQTYARVRMRGNDGETRYLSEEEKQQQIRLIQQEIDRVCP